MLYTVIFFLQNSKYEQYRKLKKKMDIKLKVLNRSTMFGFKTIYYMHMILSCYMFARLPVFSYILYYFSYDSAES